MASFPIRVSIGSDVHECHVSEAMLVQELKGYLCAMIEWPNVGKSHLWKDTLELKNNLAALRDYGVSANDLLELKKKENPRDQ